MPHVLVVDDSESIRQLIRAMLEPEGYTLAEAADGVQALAALRTIAEPCVVLLDYYMPNLDGGGVLQAVRTEGGPLADHEFLVISSSVATFPADFIDLVRYLSIRVLPKPFEKEVLAAAVAQAAERLTAPKPEPLPVAPEGGPLATA
jgi:two-component system chemotaxis response regulator CheY